MKDMQPAITKPTTREDMVTPAAALSAVKAGIVRGNIPAHPPIMPFIRSATAASNGPTPAPHAVAPCCTFSQHAATLFGECSQIAPNNGIGLVSFVLAKQIGSVTNSHSASMQAAL